MNGFSSAWLALREAADARARDRTLLDALRQHLLRGGPHHRRGHTPPAHIVDLGCGTGAGLRWLAPRLPLAQHWRLLDHDPALLSVAPRSVARWARERGLAVRRTPSGLALGDELVAGFETADLAATLPELAGVSLLSATALLDLVSRGWLHALVNACAARHTALLLALIYDGRIAFTPRHRDDARVRDALNRHQLRDKGFGPALGPGAGAAAGSLLQRAGYRVTQQRSDWCLTRADAGLQHTLLQGWADALNDGPMQRDTGWVRDWLAWRLEHREAIRVGHVDLLALPAT